MSTLSIEDIQEKISDLVCLLKKEDLDQKSREQYVTELLNMRGKLLDKFKPIIKTIERVEDEIKALKLPEGDYGVIYKLLVSNTETKVIDNLQVFKALEKEGHDPLMYAKADTTSPVVKNLINTTPGLYTLKPGAKKHYFK